MNQEQYALASKIAGRDYTLQDAAELLEFARAMQDSTIKQYAYWSKNVSRLKAEMEQGKLTRDMVGFASEMEPHHVNPRVGTWLAMKRRGLSYS